MTLTKSHCNMLFCWLLPSVITSESREAELCLTSSLCPPGLLSPANRWFPCSLWRLFVAALMHQMCLFCTPMFVFSALLVFYNSFEQWGCCWIVRITVGCWLEVTVNGLIMLTRDILGNTEDVAFTFLGERENACGWMDLFCRFLLHPPPTVQLEMTDWLCLRRLQARATMASNLYSRAPCSVLGSPVDARQWHPSTWRAAHPHPGASGYLKWAQPLQTQQWDMQRHTIFMRRGVRAAVGLFPPSSHHEHWWGWKASQFGNLSWERRNAMRKK